jgi:1-acyl-sn-glycerol-3-phosphate acyltransferase/sRNA-binding carbon storage regulator CsrA
MNRQPYETPPQWWPPKMLPWWVRQTRPWRWRKLSRKQRIVHLDVENGHYVRDAVHAGRGVLITPNHSAHYDSAALYVAVDRIQLPVYFMTAWQVFAMSNAFERWFMQRMGCFSIDRESNDRQAFKQAVSILQSERPPLVIFPEGDIYHITDIVTPFREGAAAIALAAARRADRPIVVIPCAIKFWYLDDPTPQLKQTLESIEDRLFLRVEGDRPLPERIHRIAEAALALKELDYVGRTRAGRVRDRILQLTEDILLKLELRHGIASAGSTTPERVKVLRQTVIKKIQQERSSRNGSTAIKPLAEDMADLFLIMQLYSYHGEYLLGEPSLERIAETIDKFEEDILGQELPSVRARRRVVVRFGEPITVAHGDDRRGDVATLTQQMQQRVQQLIDELNGVTSVPTKISRPASEVISSS